MCLNKCLHQRKTETGPVVVSRQCAIHLIKSFRHMRNVIFRYTDPVICNLYDDLAILGHGGQQGYGPGVVFGELERI